jgi:hypothetical protein
MLRTHDIVLVDGTFRVVMTARRRIIAAIDIQESPLGPLHLVFEVDRAALLPPDAPGSAVEPSMETAGFFDDIGKVASETFDVASKVAEVAAGPTLALAKAAATEGAKLVSSAMAPDRVNVHVDPASHVVMKARLGDVHAKQFIRTIAGAASAGDSTAQQVAEALLAARKRVAETVDVPALLASHAPEGVIRAYSPLEHFQRVVTHLQRGNFEPLERVASERVEVVPEVEERVRVAPEVEERVRVAPEVEERVRVAPEVEERVRFAPEVEERVRVAPVPIFVGQESGNPVERVIRAVYGALPLPVEVRPGTDAALETVVSLLGRPQEFSEVTIQSARAQVAPGLPQQVFDMLVQHVRTYVPVQKPVVRRIEEYVLQYAPPAPPRPPVEEVLKALPARHEVLLEQAARGVVVPQIELARLLQPAPAVETVRVVAP